MRRLLFGLLAALLAVGTASADPRYLRSSNEGGLWPAGFPRFCRVYPSECQPARPATVKASVWKDIIIRINRDVNSRIEFQSEDWDRTRQDRWVIDPAKGDCEDYAITKRRELIDAGMPSGALRLAFVWSRSTGKHTVLIISTDDGDRILDNTTHMIWTPDKTDYKWLGVQKVTNPRAWMKPGG